ncbi:MAG: CoA transferase, partial [Chloroflexi bacterium]|nr:CoA transferase [Chloroflexota bacterium]
LNLKHLRGREVAHRLAARADVLLEGFRPGVADRLGLGYAVLAAINPRLVYCSLSGYGQDGPYRDRAGHDLNYLGYAGLLALNGPAEGPPVPSPAQVADLGGGAWPAACAILAALLERERSGRGRFLDVAMLDGSLAWMGPSLAALLAGGPPLERGKLELSGALPCYQLYRAADGRFMALGALEPPFWQTFCATLGRSDLLPYQYAHGDQAAWAIAQVAAVIATQPRAAWVERFAGVDACFTPVLEPHEVPADPQVQARGLLLEAGGDSQPAPRQVAPPVRFAPLEHLPPAPELGADTEAVLAEAGYGDEAIEELRVEGVV